MTTQESCDAYIQKARHHLEGGRKHLPNALHYAYWAAVRSIHLPAAKRNIAFTLLERAIRLAGNALREEPDLER